MTYQFPYREEPFHFSSEFDEYEGGLLESEPEFEPEFDEFETAFADLEEEEQARRGPRAAGSTIRGRTPPVQLRLPPPRRRRPPRTIIRPWRVSAGVIHEPSICTCPEQTCPQHGSEYIRWVQSTLNRILGMRLPLNGVLTPATRSAIRSFQEREKLPVTGIVGPDTERALIAARSGQSPGAGATKPVEPGMMEPPEPAATPSEPDSAKPAAEFDFEWETYESDLESNLEFETAAACPDYATGEIVKSKTQAGHLPSDVIEDSNGSPLIADFGVNSDSVKDSVKKDPVLKNWLGNVLKTVVSDPSAKLRILGYSDCVGTEKNVLLRRGRAERVFQLLRQLLGGDPRWKILRSRINFVGAAPPGKYVADNSTVEGRAKNRGVVIELQRTISFQDEPITAGPCKEQVIERARKLLLSDRARQVVPAPRRERLLNVVTRLARPQKDDRYLTRSDVDTATRRVGAPINWKRVTDFFEQLCTEIAKTGRPSDDDLLHRLWLLDNMILNGICRIRDLDQSPPAHLNSLVGRAWIRSLANTISKLIADNQSVYRSYAKIGKPDCPKSGAPIPVPPKPPKPGPKPPQPGPTIPIPKPTMPIIQFRDPSVPQWLKDAISGVAKLAGISLSLLMVAIPAPVLEKAVEAAWLVFQLRNLSARALVGEAGEAAARVIASWMVEEKLSIRALNLNTIEKSFVGLDLLTTSKPFSVKTYGVVSTLSGQALEKSLQSRYKVDILKIVGDEFLQKRYQNKIAAKLLKYRTAITNKAAWPSALSGQVTESQVVTFLRENTVFLFPEDHVQMMRRHMGSEFFKMYKAGKALPSIPGGLDDNSVAGRISDMVIRRIESLGVKSTDLRALLDVAQRLPEARDAVVRRGVKKWPANWGTPPTWTSTVRRP